ncbi:expressed unknown protein [Seminavis robusta]|uniref:Uncharacterized protein n=1 Tax=Seminavis robusta TaxID=568900 RepID=A0A9N8HQL5_9STRA|nr:expressed unknown protein [Seminavis robusta]|eukprot:Sro996_g229310.1 n/a (504) ;mRNA; r:26197-27708
MMFRTVCRGLAIVAAVGFSFQLDSQFLVDYLSNAGAAAAPSISRAMSGSGSKNISVAMRRLVLEATVPQYLIDKLYNETAHSPLSPLSPNFDGLLDPRPHNQQHNNTYVGCTPTGKVQILQVQQHNHTTVTWLLQSLDQTGIPKPMGGDEYYITFTYANSNRTTPDPIQNNNNKITRHPNYVAIPTDLGNGQYALDFVEPPIQVPEWKNEQQLINDTTTTSGFLTIHLTFTCGMGLVTQKSDWKHASRGALDWCHVQHNVSMVPPWRHFTPPSMPRIGNKTQRLSQYEYVAFFGDSILGLFTGQYKKNPKFNRYPRPPNATAQQFHFVDNTRRAYAGHVAELQQLFDEWHGARIRKQTHSAIVLGSGTWDLGTITWAGGDANFTLAPTIDAHRMFWKWLLQQYPGVPVYYKSPSAVHPHAVANLQECADRERVQMGTRYVSTARNHALDHGLRQLLQEEPFRSRMGLLDVYNSTQLVAEWLFPCDTHHFNWEMNRHMLMEWFY